MSYTSCTTSCYQLGQRNLTRLVLQLANLYSREDGCQSTSSEVHRISERFASVESRTVGTQFNCHQKLCSSSWRGHHHRGVRFAGPPRFDTRCVLPPKQPVQLAGPALLSTQNRAPFNFCHNKQSGADEVLRDHVQIQEDGNCRRHDVQSQVHKGILPPVSSSRSC